MDQLISTLGAIGVLSAYAGTTSKRLDPDGIFAILLNLMGGSLLAWSALKAGSAGLILIEVAWTVISLLALARWLKRRRSIS